MTAHHPHRTRLVALISMLVLLTGVAGSCNEDGPTATDPPQTTTTGDTTPSARPDFIISSVSTQPSGLVPPGNVQIIATVRNIGAADYGQAIVVQAPGNHTAVITGLAAGASETAVIDYPAVSSNATYTMVLVVDPDNVTPEEDETNNESMTITIQTTP